MATAIQLYTKDGWVPEELRQKVRLYEPKSNLGRFVRDCLKYLPAHMAAELVDRISSCVIMESSLAVVVFRAKESLINFADRRPVEDYGIVSRKVVTTAGVNYIVDAFQNSVELENLKYHALGTSSAAEAVGDTGCTTELSTQYNPDNTRATGSTTEGGSANVYRTVGTNTVDATVTIQEHAVMSQAATGGGTCLDRSLTGGQALSSGDSLQSTYDLTCTAGS